MALACPVSLDVERLRREVAAEYTRVAEDPEGEFHFHRGFDHAVSRLGYDPGELSAVPKRAVERFAGVGNPFAIGEITQGSVVLDVGCGAGTDLLIAARRVGERGRVVGVDVTPAMRAVALQSAFEAGLAERVSVLDGDTDALPVEDASVDVVISNGVINLSSNKLQAMGEIARVLRPGGRLMMADVVLRKPLSEKARADIDLWAA